MEYIRIVLLGPSGSGKSATGNTILGENVFKTSISGSSITQTCSEKCSFRFDNKIVVVDTPAIFDMQASIGNAQNPSQGSHAFILVLSLTRFTQEDQQSLEYLIKNFGEQICDYFIVLFTRKDDLDYEGIQLSEHLKNVPDSLRKFIEKCGGRKIAFNNREMGESQSQQVKELLSMVSKIIEKNEGSYYTSKSHETESRTKQSRQMVKESEKEKVSSTYTPVLVT